MKIKTEISESTDEEIIIRTSRMTDRIRSLEAILESVIKGEREMVLYRSGDEYYVPIAEIFFFESSGGKVYAHTKDAIYTTEYKLFELENLLPSHFVRVSKSAIANIMPISSLHRELVGNGEITFRDCVKKTYFSRGYYHILRDKIEEMRLGK